MPDDPVSAEEVAHRRFSYSFRGFDPGEVRAYLDRVAEELRTATKRERRLQRQVADAEYRAAHPVIDETVLTQTLGDETSRILASAHEVARELRSKAEENAARILREAHAEAQRIRASAEVVLAERTDEAEAAAEEIRQAARTEVESALQLARQEASSIVGDAEARARHLTEEAEAAAARVVSEVGRRRRLAHAQVEQLRAGRERLLQAYRVVRRTLDEVVDELQRAEPEARQAADAVARRTGVEPVRLEGEEGAVSELEAPTGVSVAASTAVSLAGAGATAEAPTPQPAEPPPPAPEDPVPDEPLRPAVTGDETGLRPSPDVTEPEGEPPAVGEAGADPGSEGPGQIVAAGEQADDQPADDQQPDDQPAEDQQDSATSAEPEPGAKVEASVATPGGPEPVAGASQVSELFARIKADRAAAVARAQEVLAGDEAPLDRPEAEPVPADEDAAGGPGDAGDEDEQLLRERQGALEGITAGLARRLKRALQDEQNEVLDRLRSSRGRYGPDVLPTPADQANRYRDAGVDLLEQAACAGAEFIAPSTALAPDVADLADGLAESLAVPLRRRLEQGLGDDDGDDPAALAERIGAAYRECKAQRIDRLAGDATIGAFSRGTTAAASGAPLRWVVDDDGGPCPDCHDNALAGPTPSGQSYPTGQQHPPAHGGCRCLLVPATS